MLALVEQRVLEPRRGDLGELGEDGRGLDAARARLAVEQQLAERPPAGAGERDAAAERPAGRLAGAVEPREGALGADQRAGALGDDLEHLRDGAGAVDVDGRVGEVAQQLGVALRGARGGLAQLGEVEVRAHAGDQLARGERLDEVVVGARREPLDGRLLAGARREHDHRQLRGGRVRAQLRQQPEAVELGHHRVGEDQVRPARRDGLQRRSAVAHRLDVPVAGEQPLEVVAQVGVVVGDQDPRAPGRGPVAVGSPAPTASSSPTESPASGSQRSASSR